MTAELLSCFLNRANQTLTEEQTIWVKDASERVTKILQDTPPDGETFTQTVKVVI